MVNFEQKKTLQEASNQDESLKLDDRFGIGSEMFCQQNTLAASGLKTSTEINSNAWDNQSFEHGRVLLLSTWLSQFRTFKY